MTGTWHCLSGGQAAKEFGMGYVDRLSEGSNPARVDNVSFLDDYLVGDAPPALEDSRAKVLALLADRGYPFFAAS